jgi:hypothetical protein
VSACVDINDAAGLSFSRLVAFQQWLVRRDVDRCGFRGVENAPMLQASQDNFPFFVPLAEWGMDCVSY